MAGMYSDNLEFSPEQLMAQIRVLEQVRDVIVNAQKRYVEYITTQLCPNWTTAGGQKTAERLTAFANQDIQSFITYLDGRISNLTVSQQRTVQIDQA